MKLTAYHPHPSHSSKQRDEHDHTHELCEEDEWSEEGPHWPQGNVKAAREVQKLINHKILNQYSQPLHCHVVTDTAQEECGRLRCQ